VSYVWGLCDLLVDPIAAAIVPARAPMDLFISASTPQRASVRVESRARSRT
jgi:hypothetical protein